MSAPSLPNEHCPPLAECVPHQSVACLSAAAAPAAAAVSSLPAGSWFRTARGHWQLQAGLTRQLLRLAASIAATALLLLAAAAVLLACLNLQGLIAAGHSLIYMPGVAALSLPGGPLAAGLMKQVRLHEPTSRFGCPSLIKMMPSDWAEGSASVYYTLNFVLCLAQRLSSPDSSSRACTCSC